MKKVLVIIAALCLMVNPIVILAEEDYSYLDDMTINQLKALDKEIHKRLPEQTDDTDDGDDDGVKEILKSDKWVDLARIESDITFLDAGVVSYGDETFSWEIVDSTIRIAGQTAGSLFMSGSSVNKAYVLEEESGIPKLLSVTSSSIYVRESELSTALETLDIPEEIRIKSYDELLQQAGTIDVYTLLKDVQDNEAVAAKNHTGKTYIITDGLVDTVYPQNILYDSFDKTNGLDTFTLGWVRVYFASDEEMLKVKQDDKISIIGVITDVSANSVTLRNAYVYKN